MRSILRISLAAAILAGLTASPARAQSDPSFEFHTLEAVEKPVWKAELNIGLILASGNSNTLTFSGGGKAGYKDGKNEFNLELAGSYARSETLVAVDANKDGKIEANEIHPVSKESAKNWSIKGRYDRFFTEKNSLYVALAFSSDPLAGKDLVTSGQLGFSRQLYTSDRHELVAELGYDFSYEQYPTQSDPTKPDSLQVHSARFFGSYLLKLSDEINFSTSVEILSNVNPEKTPTGNADPFEDTRVNWKAGLTAKIFKNITAKFNFTAKFDNVPAPRPAFDLPYAPGTVVSADKLDTITEVSIIVSFL